MNTLPSYIDSTLLRPEAPLSSYTQLVRDAVEFSFASCCVSSFHAPLVANLLNAHPLSKVKTCCTIAFPFGESDIHTKSIEIERALSKGVAEVDVVINLSLVKTHEWKHLREELVEIREASEHHILKIILEVAALTREEIIESSKLCLEQNVDFLKTSTGYFSTKLEPAKTAEYVALLKDLTNGTRCAVKASGGISDLKACQLMIEAGASRIGTSKAKEIMTELRGELK